MFLEIQNFLTPQAVARLTALAASVNFVDGKISNPANQAKNNLHASHADPGYAESSAIVADAFARSEPFCNFAYPTHVAPPLLARYEVGMNYGAHADTSHMRFGNELRRSDLSATVWLSPPDSYDGGELVVHSTFTMLEHRRTHPQRTFGGTMEHLLRGSPGSWKIARKTVRLVNCDATMANLAIPF